MKKLLLFIAAIVSMQAAAQFRSLDEYSADGPLKVALEYVAEDNMPFLGNKDGNNAKISQRYYYAGFERNNINILTVDYSPYFVLSYRCKDVRGFSKVFEYPFFWMNDISNVLWLHKIGSKERFKFLPMTPPNEGLYFWAFDLQETKVTTIYEGYDEMDRYYAIESYLGDLVE